MSLQCLTCACICRSLLDGRYQTSVCLCKFSLLTEVIGISLSQKFTSVSHFLSHDIVYCQPCCRHLLHSLSVSPWRGSDWMISSRRIKAKIRGTADLSEDVKLSCSDSFLGVLFRERPREIGDLLWTFKFVHVPLFWTKFSNACFCIGTRNSHLKNLI